MLKRLVLPLLAVALLIWVAGCSDNSSDLGTTSSETNIAEEFGGFTTTSEEPGFGNEELLGEDEGNVEYDDPILGSSEVQAITEDVEAGLFHFRAVWGQLEYDSTFTTETDWTGSLSITRGAEVIRRVIRFETGQDYILERTAKELIEWHSITTVHNDGIAVDIFVPPVLPTYDTTFIIDDDGMGNVDTTIVVDTVYPEVEPVTVSFETGPYSQTFTLNDLVSLDTVVELDDGNSVAFQAMQFYRFSCPRGFIAGHWGFDDENTGVFEGIWMTQHGYISGYVEGYFENNEEEGKVFYGK